MAYSPAFFLSILVPFSVGVFGLKESCSKNSDCNTKGATCINGQCDCDLLSYYNDSTNQCLQYVIEYGAYCTATDQCEWVGANASCTNNHCICNPKYRWYKGQCRPYVDKGGKCETSDDCYNGYDLLSLSCSSGVCVCSTTHYDRGSDCRKASSWPLEVDCALDIDCKSSLRQLTCTLGKCTSNSTASMSIYDRVQWDPKNIRGPAIHVDPNNTLSCKKDDDCKEILNSLCDSESKSCGCIEETHYLYEDSCVPGISHCSADKDCTVNNTMCFKNTTCICKQGFFLNEGKCVAELGMIDPHLPIQEDSNCTIKPGKLVNSTCFCKDFWFSSENNRNCIKTMIQSSKSCLTNEWCYAMGPYSFCNSTTGQCECTYISRFNESTYYCDLTSDEPENDFCTKESDCKVNELCLDETCQCNEHFEKNSDGICLPNIGAPCTVFGCSHIENASCIGGSCVCDDNYVGKINNCLKIADKLSDACQEQEQCKNIEHAICGLSEDDDESDGDKNLKCVCDEGYTAISGTCYQSKKHGDPCVTKSDCTLVLNHSYQCRNSICQCAVGQKLKNGYCTSSGFHISVNYLLLVLTVLPLGISRQRLF